MRFILSRLKADALFHAAAYKHVPMMEENPVAAVHNNVLGTRNLVEAALAAGLRRLVLISTDKAVDPVSVYGASKLLAERIVLNRGEGEQMMGAGEGTGLGWQLRAGNAVDHKAPTTHIDELALAGNGGCCGRSGAWHRCVEYGGGVQSEV